MPYSKEELVYIYYKTDDGHCYYCGKRLSFVNYGMGIGYRGSWEVDHSNPKSRGGTNYLRNLVAACYECNRDKAERRGAHYKREFEPVTPGGKLVELLGLPPGFLGASRRRRRIRII